MFEPGKLLKRAFQIVWDYKVLWIFGFLIVLMGGAGGGNGGGGSGSGYNFNADSMPQFQNSERYPQVAPFMQEVEVWFEQNVQPLFATEQKAIATVLIGLAILFGVALLFGLLAALIRYPAETAVIRMVNDHEQTGTKLRFREGWKLGWNVRAWRIFLVDLLIGTPAFGIVVLLIGGLGMYFFANRQDPEAALNVGVGIWIAVVFMLMMALGFLMVVVSLVRQFIIRKIAFEDVGVWEGFRQGWVMFKLNWKHAVLTWLILLGIGIAFGIALMIAALLLIPAYAVLAIPGLLAAAIPAAIGYIITGLFSGEVLPWIIAAVVGLPILFLVMFSPITLITGVYTVFDSNVWTLLYREKNAQAVVPPLAAPQGELPLPPPVK